MKKVQSALLPKGVKVSVMIVSRRLTYDFRLKLRKPAKKPLLTKSMKAKCLAFAKLINIGPLNVGVKYSSVMNQPFSSLR